MSVLVLGLVLLLAADARGGQLPTIVHEGRAYVSLDRLAATLDTRPDATPSSIRAYLRVPGHVVTLTRNWAHVDVNGAALVLESPVRVRAGQWLVPAGFVKRVLPRLAAPAPPASPRAVAAVAGPARVTAQTAQLSPSGPVPPARSGARASLEDLRYRSYPSFTRLVLETSDAVRHTVEPAGGRELRVRIEGLAGEPRVEEIRDGLVDEVTLERAGGDAVLRVRFEGVPGETKVTTLDDPHRLVLDLRRPVEAEERDRGAVTPLRLIVLDAGHGGHDSGAVGPQGLMEKDLVLDVTKRVAKLVADRLGVKVRLTRDGDHFVTLRDRTRFANRERADLFVSIHANAHPQAANTGVETYFLSSEATDSGARQVAALENSVIQLEAPSPRGARQQDVVKAILWDLAQSEFQAESSRLAEIVQDSMTQSLRIANRGVKQAGFYVLGGAAMPAVLVEIGFVTNPGEERRLKDGRYRDDIARAIFTGLAEYKRNWDQRARTTAEQRPR
ncbi:MAG TPA: N-acetylmuramoyl-L-alanine amidase [Methylomirabilota bacterium]|nr:N-acetylmuramoyl-L-alanine amidase [Methylomirabilota bacterium]